MTAVDDPYQWLEDESPVTLAWQRLLLLRRPRPREDHIGPVSHGAGFMQEPPIANPEGAVAVSVEECPESGVS